MNLLVVDWDYFFPEAGPGNPHWLLYDWGHNENSSLYYGFLWVVRAAGFDRAGVPRPVTSGEEVGFWSRFNIARTATLFYAESNVAVVNRKIYGGSRVSGLWLYDAHHDGGYKRTLEEITKDQHVSCEDWTAFFHLKHGTQLHVRYPRWKSWALEEPEPAVPLDRRVDDGGSPRVLFDRVFVCRSGAWTPPWLDQAFFRFLEACPAERRVELDGDLHPVKVRDWDEADVARDLAAVREAQRQMAEAQAKEVTTDAGQV